jgi:hypothetical protein
MTNELEGLVRAMISEAFEANIAHLPSEWPLTNLIQAVPHGLGFLCQDMKTKLSISVEESDLPSPLTVSNLISLIQHHKTVFQ